MSIRRRLILGFTGLLAVLVLVVVLTNQSVRSIEERMEDISAHRVPTAAAISDLESSLYASLLALRSWMLTEDTAYKRERVAAWRKIESLRDTLDGLSRAWAPDMVARWSRFKIVLDELHRTQDDIEKVAHSVDQMPATKLLLNEAIPLSTAMFQELTALIDLEKQLPATPQRKALLAVLADLRATVTAASGHLRSYVFTGDHEHLEMYREMLRVQGERLSSLNARESLLTPEQRIHRSSYDSAYRAFMSVAEQMIRIRSSDDWNLATALLLSDAVPRAQYLIHTLSGVQRDDGTRGGGLVDIENERLVTSAHDTVAELGGLERSTWLLFAIGLIASVLVARFTARSIVDPITSLVAAVEDLTRGDTTVAVPETQRSDEVGHMARTVASLNTRLQDIAGLCGAISTGDYSQELEVRSDVDLLAVAVNKMVEDFRQIVSQARRIAHGDYTTELAPKSDGDTLGVALAEMTSSLRDMSEKNARDSWLRNGQRVLAEVMQGKQSTEELSRNVIASLARYLDASIGALYVAEDGRLRMAGSYAYTARKHLDTDIAPGQGLVGQAARERQRILLTQVPDDYIHVASGLGEARPKHIVVQPLLMDDDVKGVVELGSLAELGALQLELLALIGENIAIAINTAQNLHNMQVLLEQSRVQTEELKMQSEELQAANEELAEKTQRLARSQKELQAQSEELQATNEELEEKTQYLELKKNEIEIKNRELDVARQELQERADELERSSKYKSQFLANMSHELRTPLNSILILARMLADNQDGTLDDDQVRAAQVIHSGGKDLLHLINDILDLSKVEAGMLRVLREPVDLDSLCTGLRHQFEPVAADRGVEFAIERDDDAPEVVDSDRQRLEQILRNLLSNAFKFIEKGVVRLRIHRISESDRERVALPRSGIDAGSALAFSVIDTGVGIPENKLQEIFEAFQQADGSTSRKYGGTGLGLTISRELARLLGGEIRVRSELGVGSTFTLYLPLEPPSESAPGDEQPGAWGLTGAAAEAGQGDPRAASANDRRSYARTSPEAAPAGQSAPPPRESGRQSSPRLSLRSSPRLSPQLSPRLSPQDSAVLEGKSLLIIEDDVAFAQILMKMAHEKGYRCTVATDGSSGLRLALESRPSAIILDLGLPGLDGLTVLEQLKFDLRTRHIPVHIISARSHSTAAMQLGALGYLVKPVTVEDIAAIFARVERHLEKRVKSVLVVEDDSAGRDAIIRLIASDAVAITAVSTGEEAAAALRDQEFDCVILDLHLPDTSGLELLRTLEAERALVVPPIIIYTGRDLSREEHAELSEYASSIVIKGVNSPERLVDEASLFLHSVEAALPPEQQGIIRTLHDPDKVLRGKKILLVDDNVRNSFALSGALRKHGVEVILADNGQLALDKLEQMPDIDLVIMDIMMPVMDGYTAMARIREQPRWHGLPVIALTAKAMPEDRVRCLEAGANDYLTKPVDMEQLLALMRVWLFKA